MMVGDGREIKSNQIKSSFLNCKLHTKQYSSRAKSTWITAYGLNEKDLDTALFATLEDPLAPFDGRVGRVEDTHRHVVDPAQPLDHLLHHRHR
mgnify:CR=1 FL=1